ncbi:tol-pal system YbgF family protein [Streptomyces sp. NPDC014776]|uniref:tetratricopeptide repeat protein n=1 Tax=unclassified Streptomyces TaxID=2593676 RepID=UPI0036F61FC2
MANIWPLGQTASEIYAEDERQRALSASVNKQWSDWPQLPRRRNEGESAPLAPIAAAYLNARSLFEEERYPEAFDAFLACMRMASQPGDSPFVISCMFYCANIMEGNGRYDEALRVYAQLTSLVEQSGSDRNKAALYFHRGTTIAIKAMEEPTPTYTDELRESVHDLNKSLWLYHTMNDCKAEHVVIDNIYIVTEDLKDSDRSGG